MAYVIGSDCIGCGACEAECPVSCIKPDGGVFAIDAGSCIDCGACSGACPVGAINQG